jgi:hypothetical protein
MARIYWLSKSATDREAEAAITLAKQLPESWAIVCNKFVFTTFQRRFEVDMVIVGAHGVYVLDEKSWKGPVTCDTEYWRNGRFPPEKSPIQNMENAAAVLGTQLRKEIDKQSLRSGPAWFVDAFVLFSRTGVRIHMDQCPAPDRILRLADAAVVLTGLDAHHREEDRDLRECRDVIVKWLLGGKPSMGA